MNIEFEELTKETVAILIVNYYSSVAWRDRGKRCQEPSEYMPHMLQLEPKCTTYAKEFPFIL